MGEVDGGDSRRRSTRGKTAEEFSVPSGESRVLGATCLLLLERPYLSGARIGPQVVECACCALPMGSGRIPEPRDGGGRMD